MRWQSIQSNCPIRAFIDMNDIRASKNFMEF